MTPTQLGNLTGLFDEIKSKINGRDLTYTSVKGGLQTILAGNTLPTVVFAHGPMGVLLFKSSLNVKAVGRTNLKIVEGRYGHALDGYDEFGIELSSFFTESPQPSTEGGDGAILETTRRLTLLDFAQEVLSVPVSAKDTTLDKKLFESGVTFSVVQLLEILRGGLSEANKRKSRIFFVHNSDLQVGAVSVSSAHTRVYGRDWDGQYSYADKTNLLVRTLPQHLRPPQ